MRTRLDEIVEEELKKWNGFVWSAVPWRTVMGELAERAFRHGVERCIAESLPDGYVLDLKARHVQPAPAEEKHDGILIHPGNTTADTNGDGAEPWTPHVSPVCFCTEYRKNFDRRKGERRNRVSYELTGIDGQHWYSHYPSPISPLHVDRRAGKDRRK